MFNNDKAGLRNGRERKPLKKQTALTLMLVVGIILLIYSLGLGVTKVGGYWFGEKSTELWHMNNYFIIEGQYAYIIFGLTTMIIGGLATGLTMPAFFLPTKTKKHIILLLTTFFTAIIMSGLGFNTLDFMLGDFYWTNMQQPPPVQVPMIGAVEAWNFYFFFFVVPLWASGFILGIATAYYSYKSKDTTTAHITQKTKAQIGTAGIVTRIKANTFDVNQWINNLIFGKDPAIS
jgi:hypothetical protein